MPSFHRCTASSAKRLEACCRVVGQSAAWLTAVMALVTCGVVIARALGIGSILAQESIVFMHAAVLTIVSAYTLSENEHVRVDIFYRRRSSVEKAWIDAFGIVFFLLPLSLFTVGISWDFVAHSWQHAETSQNAGGLGGVYWMKSLIIVNGLLLSLQALAMLAKQLLIITYHQALHD